MRQSQTAEKNNASVDVESWSVLRKSIDWKQGEHVTALGASGSGKSTLLLDLISKRRYVVLMLTKRVDPTLATYIKRHKFVRISRWPAGYDDDRIAFWPVIRHTTDYKVLAPAYAEVIDGNDKRKVQGAFEQGNWTILFDEMRVMDKMGITDAITATLTQGRSSGLSIVSGAQRPRHVPVEMLSEPTHLFLFHCSDKYDLDRLSDIGGRRVNEIKAIVPQLHEYQFLYVNKRNGTIAISKVGT